MTKRAGKRKHRMGTQRHPPGKIVNGPKADRDVLPEAKKEKLEIRAAREGWYLDNDGATKFRQALLQRVMNIGLKSSDERTVIQAFKALTTAELRQLQLDAAGEGTVVNVAVNNQVAVAQSGVGEDAGSEPDAAYSVVQQLIARREVREAIGGSV